ARLLQHPQKLVHHFTVTRASLSLPTLITYVLPASSAACGSVTREPSISTAFWPISRRASPFDRAMPAAAVASTSLIRLSDPAATVYSGRSSLRTSRLEKRARKASWAASAAPLP